MLIQTLMLREVFFLILVSLLFFHLNSSEIALYSYANKATLDVDLKQLNISLVYLRRIFLTF